MHYVYNSCVCIYANTFEHFAHIYIIKYVYMCMLDASKAFDRVNLLTLFKTLYSRGMCPIYLRLLMKIYEEQNMRIRWNNTVTDYFTISNGVKDGVLSFVQFVLGPTHITAQTYWYGLSYKWFIHGSIYIC